MCIKNKIMTKLEFTNRSLENLNKCISENGKVELFEFIELSNKLYEAIIYKPCCMTAECYQNLIKK